MCVRVPLCVREGDAEHCGRRVRTQRAFPLAGHSPHAALDARALPRRAPAPSPHAPSAPPARTLLLLRVLPLRYLSAPL